MSFLVNPFRFAPAVGEPTPVLDQVNTQRIASFSTSQSSGTLTVGSLADGLLVVTLAGRNDDDDCSGLEWSGDALTELIRLDHSVTPNAWDNIWYLAAPNAATDTLDATFPVGGGDADGINDGAFTWYFFSGVHQTHLVRIAGQAEGSASAASVNFTTLYPNSYLILAATAQGGNATGVSGLTAGWTARHDDRHTLTSPTTDLSKFDATGMGTATPGAGSVSWTWGANQPWVGVVLEVVPANAS